MYLLFKVTDFFVKQTKLSFSLKRIQGITKHTLWKVVTARLQFDLDGRIFNQLVFVIIDISWVWMWHLSQLFLFAYLLVSSLGSKKILYYTFLFSFASFETSFFLLCSLLIIAVCPHFFSPFSFSDFNVEKSLCWPSVSARLYSYQFSFYITYQGTVKLL